MGSISHSILVKVNGHQFLVEVGDLDRTPVIAVVEGQTFEVVLGEGEGEPREVSPPQRISAARSPSTGTDLVRGEALIAPLPGDIVEISVEPGQDVHAGDPICILYAMKMNNVIRSPRTGRIASVPIKLGQSVDYGETLVTYD